MYILWFRIIIEYYYILLDAQTGCLWQKDKM